MDLTFNQSFVSVTIDDHDINLDGKQLYLDGVSVPTVLGQLRDQYAQDPDVEGWSTVAAALQIALLARDSFDEQTSEQIVPQMRIIAKRLLTVMRPNHNDSRPLGFVAYEPREPAKPYNPFRLCNQEHPEFAETTTTLRAVCVKAVNEIVEIQEQCADVFGATDSESRDALIDYIGELVNYPPKRRAEDIELWRLVKIHGGTIGRKNKHILKARLNFANSLLDQMGDDDLLACLKIDSEQLPWVREQIAELKAEEKAKFAKITKEAANA